MSKRMLPVFALLFSLLLPLVHPTPVRALTLSNEWNEVDAPTAQMLFAISVADDTFFAVGESGTVVYSEDGDEWQKGDSNTSNDLYDVAAISNSKAVAVGEGGIIIRTTDGGETWEEADSPTNDTLRAVVMASANIGFAVGEDGMAVQTTDGGETWEKMSDLISLAEASLNSVSAINTANVWVVGEDGVMYFTEDGGENWEEENSGTSQNLVTVSFINAASGWASGDNRTFLRTSNGGSTWSKVTISELDSDETINDISFIDGDEGMLASADGTFLGTDDGGLTWNEVDVDGSASPTFVDITTDASDQWWAVGDDGTIYRFDEGTYYDSYDPEEPTDFDVSGSNSRVTDTTPTFTWTASEENGADIDYYMFKMDGGSYKNIGNVTSKTYTTELDDGDHTAYLYAVDEDGNTSRVAELDFTVVTDGGDDSGPEEPTDFDVSGNNSHVTDTTPTFTWTASEENGADIDYYMFKVDSDSYRNVGDVDFKVYLTPLDDGDHTAYVYAVDEDGNKSSVATLDFTVDEDYDGGSSGSLDISSVTPSTALKNETITFSVRIDDTGDVASCELYIDGDAEKTMTVKTDMAYTTHKFTSTGTHELEVRCEDEDGDVSSGDETDVKVSTESNEASAGDIIKIRCTGNVYVNDPCTAVYYYGVDGKRHAFPNETVFKTWFNDYDDLIELTSSEMSDIAVGRNVTYRPGSSLVKFSTSAVYAVSYGGILRPLESGSVAKSIFGSDWVSEIDTVNDAFYGNYRFGSLIETSSDYSESAVKAATDSIDDTF